MPMSLVMDQVGSTALKSWKFGVLRSPVQLPLFTDKAVEATLIHPLKSWSNAVSYEESFSTSAGCSLLWLPQLTAHILFQYLPHHVQFMCLYMCLSHLDYKLPKCRAINSAHQILAQRGCLKVIIGWTWVKNLNKVALQIHSFSTSMLKWGREIQ